MGYWKSKVLPKIKKVFDKTSPKKTAASEAVKSFDDSKEEICKQCEDSRTELQPKVVEIYAASSTDIKTLIKEPKEAGLKKHSTAVVKFIDELVKIEFPGSKAVSELSTKFGPPLVSGPVFFVFEKVSAFVVTEEKVEEPKSGVAEEETREIEKTEEVVIEKIEEAGEPALAACEAVKAEEAEPPKP